MGNVEGDRRPPRKPTATMIPNGRVEPTAAGKRSPARPDRIDASSLFVNALSFARRFDAAIGEAQTGIEIGPNYYLFHMGGPGQI